MKKSILCAIDDSIYEAFVEVVDINSTKVHLECSKLDKGWTPKALAKAPVSLENTGNGIQVYFDDGKHIFLDYSQVVELRAILNIEDSINKKPATLRKWSPK